MNKILVSFYSVFLIAFVLKFFHIHFTAVFMLFSLGGILLLGLINLFKKEKRPEALIILSTWSWMVVLLISIKFFPFGPVMLVIAAVLSIVTIYLAHKMNQVSKLFFLGICMVTAVIFYLTPTHTRFYVLNVKWSYEIDTDFITLDKYSWFLFQNDQQEKALEVSDQALIIAKELGDEQWAKIIQDHNQSIVANDWSSFR